MAELREDHRILRKVIQILRETLQTECKGKRKLRSLIEEKIRGEFSFWQFRCATCKEWFEVSIFPTDGSTKHGKRAYCFGCDKIYRYERYWANREKALAIKKRSYYKRKEEKHERSKNHSRRKTHP